MAALGSASSALADQTFSGPFITDPILNGDAGLTTINLNATVLADANNDSFYNGIGMVSITVDSSYLSGAIHNAGAGVISGGVGVLIQNNSQIDGGIWNQGSIDGSGYGITIDGDSSVDIRFLNDGTITGVTGGVMLGAGSDITGGATNNGLISGAIGFDMNGASSELRGGIVNNLGATIRGTTTAAINVSGAAAQLKGGITNSGTIEGTGNAEGIIQTAGTIAGGILNNTGAVIRVGGTSNTAISLTGGNFTGNLTNNGQVLANGPQSWGINVGGTNIFAGDIVNATTGLISADSHAIYVSTAGTFTGSILNSGQIQAQSTGTGILIQTAGFTGQITNQSTGTITAFNDGVSIAGGTFTGGVTNVGRITAGNHGIDVELGATVTGVINNTGTIVGDSDASTAGNGINVGGQVTGGITNSGTIRSSADGINVTGAATTITQTAGLIQGTTNALNLQNAAADTFNADGGTLDGNVTGNGSDDFIMHPSGTFSYLRGTAVGLDQLDMQGTGTAVLGAALRGSSAGLGVNITTTSMSHTGTGTLYLDDDTVVNTGTYTQTAGILEFQLTSDTAAGAYGTIAATGNVTLGGEIAAYIQGDTFASVGGNTFTYQDVITGTIAGTFTNAGTIDTNSIFFTGVAQVNAADVDIILSRQSFTNALALPNLSQNQQTIGGQLEAIYTAGGYSPEFTSLFNYILSLPAGSEAEAARVYDDIGGAEHASLQDIGLRTSNAFTGLVGGRLDDLRGSASGSASAALRRYADATPANVAMDAPSRPSGMRGTTSIWGRGYGSWTNSDGDAEAAGYDQDTGGVAGGLDFAVDERWNIGGAFGVSSTDIEFATSRDSANLDTFQFAGYGAYSNGRFYTDMVVALGFHDISAARFIDVTTGAPVVANADYDANSFGVRTEAGMIFDSGRIAFTPFLGLGYTSTSTDGFAESGAGPFGLLVAASDADSLATTLGMRLSGAWKAGGVRLVPTAEIAWRHEFLDDNQNFSAAFLEDPATQFQIISAQQTRDSIIAKLGMGAQVSKSVVLFVDYNAILSSSANTHAASAGLRATW